MDHGGRLEIVREVEKQCGTNRVSRETEYICCRVNRETYVKDFYDYVCREVLRQIQEAV